MTAHTVDVVDSLALLSTKVASNVFDLSSGMHHVSIRDQMVRAQLAVRDLRRGDPKFQALLIVGAGVAGISAALEAVERGVERVVVVEVEGAPFHLLRGVHSRHVGPYMYEWPSTFCRNQSYPHHKRTTWSDAAVAPLHWAATEPISASSLAELLTEDLKSRLEELTLTKPEALTICVGVNRRYVRDFVQEFARVEAARALARLQRRVPIAPVTYGYYNDLQWPWMTPAERVLTPAYVMLAAGMGVEKTLLISKNEYDSPYVGPNFLGPRFWAQDSLLEPQTAKERVAIFGGGDGALQDALRALTGREQPLQFMTFLESAPDVRVAIARVMPRLLDADRQGRQFGTWTAKRNEYRTIDDTCRAIAKELANNVRVVRRVGQGLRQGPGEVTLFVRGGYFDKTYLLNRFVVHLVEACGRAQKGMWSGRMRLRVKRHHWAVGYSTAPDGQHEVKIAHPEPPRSLAICTHVCDTIAVRYGIEPGSVPGAQMIQVSDRPSRQRTSLSRVELPFVAEAD